MPIDRDTYFAFARQAPFGGKMNDDQVAGQDLILGYFEDNWDTPEADLRWLAYILATAKWETAHTMQPIEEYGKGSGKEYGKTDPETGQAYYGRGLVQLTWRDNYARAAEELDLVGTPDDLELRADRALDPAIATEIIFQGMDSGWFTGKKLSQYFNDAEDDPKNARQIVNGNDKDDEIAAIHQQFLAALKASWSATKVAYEEVTVQVVLRVPAGTEVSVVGAAVVTET